MEARKLDKTDHHGGAFFPIASASVTIYILLETAEAVQAQTKI